MRPRNARTYFGSRVPIRPTFVCPIRIRGKFSAIRGLVYEEGSAEEKEDVTARDLGNLAKSAVGGIDVDEGDIVERINCDAKRSRLRTFY